MLLATSRGSGPVARHAAREGLRTGVSRDPSGSARGIRIREDDIREDAEAGGGAPRAG